MNIGEFNPGDLITRNEPSAPFSGARSFLSFEREEPHRDRSYIADPLTLIGVENGLIVLRQEEGITEDKSLILAIDKWGDGWVPYPKELVDRATQ
jgi:hypothetical protein